MHSGKFVGALSLLSVFFAYAYADGMYAYPTNALTQSLFSVALPTLLFILFPVSWLRSLEHKLVFYREKHLSRIAINRNRATVGKQLYEISDVFREVEHAFTSLGTTEAEEGARAYMQASIVEELCRNCPAHARCKQKNAFAQLQKLVEVGCLKGKVSLIDLPVRLSDVCIKQSDLLYAVNKRLGEYRAYMTEAENASSGRALLARQAQGVSEILRNLALEQSEPMKPYTDRERALAIALQKSGVLCSELLLYGDENDLTLSLVSFDRADVKKIAAVASHILQTPMMVTEKILLSGDKFCCVLRKKPYFDAAFGVATRRKHGETASGDTHSVLKIDERRFLVALSDGMGSGEYAKRVSESTISLLESFYRAKMPPDTVLSTVNKLLTFSKEETFACVDIAIVDLDNGNTDLVKIGSPTAFILSGNTVKVLESHSLPLGILDCLRPDTATHTLQENDTLLFISDGISDAFGSTADLYDALKKIPLHNPQQLADVLLDEALQRYEGVAKDDMTAVAVRLFKGIA
jgi:stage II sporulation protein E